MDSARSWFHKFQPRDKTRAMAKKKEEDDNGGNEEVNEPVDEASLSDVTKQRVAAAKQYIENHYKEQMKNLQERKERGFRIGALRTNGSEKLQQFYYSLWKNVKSANLIDIC